MSHDLWNEQYKTPSLDCVQLVTLQVDGQDIAFYCVSKAFAERHNIAGAIPLESDVLPIWTKEMTGVCRKCLEENR
jgi:hypothetical protein